MRDRLAREPSLDQCFRLVIVKFELVTAEHPSFDFFKARLKVCDQGYHRTVLMINVLLN